MTLDVIAHLDQAAPGSRTPHPGRGGGHPARPCGARGTAAPGTPPEDSERTRGRTRYRLRLAEAAYAQYRSEPGTHHEAAPDWPAALNFAVHTLVGANWLPRIAARHLDGEVPAAAAIWAREAAESTAAEAARASDFAPGGIRIPPLRLPYAIDSTPAGQVPSVLPPLPVLTDVEIWLVTLRPDLRAMGDDIPP